MGKMRTCDAFTFMLFGTGSLFWYVDFQCYPIPALQSSSIFCSCFPTESVSSNINISSINVVFHDKGFHDNHIYVWLLCFSVHFSYKRRQKLFCITKEIKETETKLMYCTSNLFRVSISLVHMVTDQKYIKTWGAALHCMHTYN